MVSTACGEPSAGGLWTHHRLVDRGLQYPGFILDLRGSDGCGVVIAREFRSADRLGRPLEVFCISFWQIDAGFPFWGLHLLPAWSFR